MNLSIIKELRKNKGLSQKELAHLLNVSPAYIQQIEAGKKNPSVSTLKRIASALEVELSVLLDNHKQEESIPNNNINSSSYIPLNYLNKLFDYINNNISISDKVDNVYLLENIYKSAFQHLKNESNDMLNKLSTENINLRLSLAYLQAENDSLKQKLDDLEELRYSKPPAKNSTGFEDNFRKL